MKLLKPLLGLLVASAIIQFVACEKNIDFNKAIQNCKIKKIHFFGYYENSDYEVDFYYNKWGNPDSLIFTRLQFENYNLYFLYNHKKQLVVLQEGSRFGYPEVLHRFGYVRGLITTDTVDTWADFHFVNYFEYDRYGRISKSTIVPIGLPPLPENSIIQTYEYNAEGNSLRHNPFGYDRKLNPHQLHPYWQFIARDYSLNNPITAIQYNNFGLPTKFMEPNPSPFSYYQFLGNSLNALDRSEIFYECK